MATRDAVHGRRNIGNRRRPTNAEHRALQHRLIIDNIAIIHCGETQVLLSYRRLGVEARISLTCYGRTLSERPCYILPLFFHLFLFPP